MRTILIADEDAGIRELISLVFSDSDIYRVMTVSSGVNAILKAREIKPDIALVDVFLRDKDGYEVSREIKGDPLLKNTAVILLTASLGLFNETKAAEAGADDFIIKPCGSKELIKRLESLIDEEEPSKADRGVAKSLIGQYGNVKVKFASMVIVLIVIFMVTAPILYKNLAGVKSKLTRSSNPLPSKADITLHSVESKSTPVVKREEKIVMTMNDKREIFIENRKYALSELKAEIPILIKSHGKKIEDEGVSLRAGAEVPYDAAMEAMDEIKRIGVKNVELVMEPVSVFEWGQSGSGGIHGEEVKTSRLEKKGVPEELQKVEAGKEERLRVKEQKPRQKDEKPIKARREEAKKKGIAVMPTINPGGKYAVQVGAYQKEEEAKKIVEGLKSKGYPAFVETTKGSGQGTWYRVRIGLFKTRGEAKLYGNTLKGREPSVRKVLVVVEEEKDAAAVEASSSGKEKETQEGGGYLAGIKITGWSIYVTWCVPTVHHITIENTNDTAYRDIKVRARYYSASYSNTETTEMGESMGILHITLPPHSKKTYLERGVALERGSACGTYVGSGDIEALEAVPVSYSDISENQKQGHKWQ